MRDSRYIKEHDYRVEVPTRPWRVSPHTTVAKKFSVVDVHGYPVMWFDYDDVDHAAVDLTAEYIVWAVNSVGS